MTRIPPNIRQEVFERDDYRCQICGIKGGDFGEASLVAHHTIPEEEGGEATVANLITLCRKHHVRYHRSGVPDPDLQSADPKEYSIDLSEADRDIIGTLENHGRSSTSDIIEAVGISREHCRRRLWALMAEGIVDRWYESGEWDLADCVEKSAKNRWPETPKRAAKLASHEMMRRLDEYGIGHEEIAEIADVHPCTVRVALNHARALRPPLFPNQHSSDESNSSSKGNEVNHKETLNESQGSMGNRGFDHDSGDKQNDVIRAIERLREDMSELKHQLE